MLALHPAKLQNFQKMLSVGFFCWFRVFLLVYFGFVVFFDAKEKYFFPFFFFSSQTETNI